MAYFSSTSQRGKLLQFLICGYENGNVQFINDTNSDGVNRVIYDSSFHKAKVVTVSVYREGRTGFLLSAAADNSLVVCRLDPLRIEQVFTLFGGQQVSFLALNNYPNGTLVASDNGALVLL